MSFLILLTSLRDLATYTVFYLNQDYISQNSCINRYKPELMCHGKCVLKDSLIENYEKEDKKPPSPPKEERTVFYLPIKTNTSAILTSYHLNKGLIAYKLPIYAFEYLKKVFHPPIISF